MSCFWVIKTQNGDPKPNNFEIMDQESGLAHDSKFDCSSKKKKQLVMIIDNKPWLEVEEKQKITKKKKEENSI